MGAADFWGGTHYGVKTYAHSFKSIKYTLKSGIIGVGGISMVGRFFAQNELLGWVAKTQYGKLVFINTYFQHYRMIFLRKASLIKGVHGKCFKFK